MQFNEKNIDSQFGLKCSFAVATALTVWLVFCDHINCGSTSHDCYGFSVAQLGLLIGAVARRLEWGLTKLQGMSQRDLHELSIRSR